MKKKVMQQVLATAFSVCVIILLGGCSSLGENLTRSLGSLDEGNIYHGLSFEVTFPKNFYFTPVKLNQKDVRVEKRYFGEKHVKNDEWPSYFWRMVTANAEIYYYNVEYKSVTTGAKSWITTTEYSGFAQITEYDLLQPILQYLENTVTPQQVMRDKRGDLNIYYASIVVADPKGKRYEHAMVVHNPKRWNGNVTTFIMYSGFGEKAKIDGENIYKSIRPIQTLDEK